MFSKSVMVSPQERHQQILRESFCLSTVLNSLVGFGQFKTFQSLHANDETLLRPRFLYLLAKQIAAPRLAIPWYSRPPVGRLLGYRN